MANMSLASRLVAGLSIGLLAAGCATPRPTPPEIIWTRTSEEIEIQDISPSKHEEVLWSGGSVSNRADGVGVVRGYSEGRPTGDAYEGQMKDGVMHGLGIKYTNDGDKYLGRFVSGEIVLGAFIRDDGLRYSGEFSGGKIGGGGRISSPSPIKDGWISAVAEWQGGENSIIWSGSGFLYIGGESGGAFGFVAIPQQINSRSDVYFRRQNYSNAVKSSKNAENVSKSAQLVSKSAQRIAASARKTLESSLDKEAPETTTVSSSQPIPAPKINWLTTTEGIQIQNPNPRENESASWTGGSMSNRAEGVGVLRRYLFDQSTGDVYEGQMKNGAKHGLGVNHSAARQEFRGNFDNGEATLGVLRLATGQEYAGEFEQGNVRGYGVATSAPIDNWEYMAAKWTGMWKGVGVLQKSPEKVHEGNMNITNGARGAFRWGERSSSARENAMKAFFYANRARDVARQAELAANAARKTQPATEKEVKSKDNSASKGPLDKFLQDSGWLE